MIQINRRTIRIIIIIIINQIHELKLYHIQRLKQFLTSKGIWKDFDPQEVIPNVERNEMNDTN